MNLDTYVPGVRMVEISGERIEIGALKLRQLAAFSQAVRPLLEDLERGELLKLVEERTEQVVKLLMAATDQPAKIFLEAKLEEVMEGLAVILEMNLDFFVHRLPELVGRLLKPMQTIGVISSPPSASPDSRAEKVSI